MKEFDPKQSTIVTLDILVDKNHRFRRIFKLFNFTNLWVCIIIAKNLEKKKKLLQG